MAYQPAQAQGLRLLALDGGGIRGLSELLILEEIMHRIKTEENLQDVPRPCEYFDLIGGTGTGGLIAILLGRLCMSVSSAIAAYTDITGKVFSKMKCAWKDGTFKASALEAAMKEIVARYDVSRDENARMMSPPAMRNGCKTFVCATPAHNMAHPRLFRSYEARSNQEYNATIWEAARATTAATRVFKRIKIGSAPPEEFIDSGLGCNNPSKLVLREAQSFFGSGSGGGNGSNGGGDRAIAIACILSIGAGHPKTISLRRPEGMQRLFPTELVRVLVRISTDCELVSQDFEADFGGMQQQSGGARRYFRFNVQQGLQDVSFAEWTRLGEVKTHTLQYLRGAMVGREIDMVRDLLRLRETLTDEHGSQASSGSRHLMTREMSVAASGSRHLMTREMSIAASGSRHLMTREMSVDSGSLRWIRKVKASLSVIFDTLPYYKRLLSCTGREAQNALDAFQTLLDTDSFNDRGQLIAAMRRLSGRTNLYPSRFFLNEPPETLGDTPDAAGKFADVYRVVSQEGEEICFKVIRQYRQKNYVKYIPKVYAREVIVWAQLSHPNILPFYGLVRLDGTRLAFVSRWAKNGDVREYLDLNPDANRSLLCSDTAAGMEYLHQNNIVHGDLKGLNVLIDSSGRAALADFGLSGLTDPQILKWTTLSQVGSIGGTSRWQAPELLDEQRNSWNTKASDVFAWANVCYEIFTGRVPYYETENMATVVLSILRGETPTRPEKGDAAWHKHRLTQGMWKLMEECWAFEADRRPDASAVLARIQTGADTRGWGEWGLVRGGKGAGGLWEGLSCVLERAVHTMPP